MAGNPPRDLKQRAMIMVPGTLSALAVNTEIPVVWDILGLTAVIPQLATFLSMAGVTFWLIACVPLLAKKAGLP